MQIRNEEPPGVDLAFTRRVALGGLLAAILTPALLSGSADLPAFAQSPGAVSAVPIPRIGHSTTMLGDGSVHVAGGYYLGILSDVQIYSPGTNSWSETGSMNIPRTRHAAAMLPGGQVLVCGGIYLGEMSDAEVYDPVAGAWSTVAPMNIVRSGHSAAAVSGGVLVYGGDNLGPTASPEFYNGSSWALL